MSGERGTGVWVERSKHGAKLTVVSDRALHVVEGETSAIEEWARRIRQGEEPQALLGSSGKTFVFDRMARVQMDERDRILTIVCRRVTSESDDPGGRPRHHHTWGTTFLTKSSRDEVFETLRLRLPGFVVTRKVTTRVTASVGPVLLLLLTLLCTTTAPWWVPTDFRHTPRRRHTLDGVLWLLGPTGVTLLGVALTGVAAWWLFKTLRTPPIWVTLRRTDE